MTIWIIVFTALTFFGIRKIETQQHQLNEQPKIIQAERVKSILRSCRDQNERHDRTIKKLDNLLLQLAQPQRVRAARTRGFTVALIDALAPRQNCKKLVARSVPSAKSVTTPSTTTTEH